MFDIIEHLQIRPELKQSILSFREQYPVEEQLQSRIPVPDNIYYGTDIWEKAVTALLCGKNILLVGHKATGKNIFAENLAAAFGSPRWDVSFHVNMDAASLIGMDTFKNQEVVFRPDRRTAPGTDLYRGDGHRTDPCEDERNSVEIFFL